jgi:hypothetical protein
MYGVMVVVTDLDAWEKVPKAPADPLTRGPMPSEKHDPGGPPHEH